MLDALFLNVRITIVLLCLICIFQQPKTVFALAFESTEEAKAFETGDLKAVKQIVGQKHYFKDQPNSVIVDALYSAIHSGNLDVVKYLKSQGWLDNCRDNKTCRPIHAAAKQSFKTSGPIIRYFISQGFSPDLVDQGGNTPLHYAARAGHIRLVKYLCELGVDPAIKNRYYKMTALEMALLDAGTGQLSSDPKKDAQIRIGLKKVIAYLKSGQCKIQ